MSDLIESMKNNKETRGEATAEHQQLIAEVNRLKQ